MQITAVRAVALITLVVLAFGALAATLDSAEPPSNECEPVTETAQGETATPTEDCVPDPERPEPTRGGRSGLNTSGDGGYRFGCPAPLSTSVGLFGLLGVMGIGVAVVGRLRGTFVVPAVVVAPIGLGVVGACRPGLLGTIATVAPGPDVLLGGVVVALLGAVGLLFVMTGDAVFSRRRASSEPTGSDLSAVGEAAGEAADRIAADADVDNEVFRAWREMVRHLDVSNPDATTPDEFERAAIEAGMSEQDVATITRLFEDVRYGGQDPETHAGRAIDALRRIEAEYAETGVESPGGTDDGPSDRDGRDDR